MNLVKNILHINLKTGGSEVRSYAGLGEYLGGLGTGLKLWDLKRTQSPVILTNGVFTAVYPFAAFTCATFWDKNKKKVTSTYAGGRFASSMRFSGLDGIVLEGKAAKPTYIVIDDGRVMLFEFSSQDKIWGKATLPDRKSSLVVLENKVLVDGYFNFAKKALADSLKRKNLLAVMVAGSHFVPILKPELYKKVYAEILKVGESLQALQFKGSRSCSGCHLACLRARRGGSGPDAFLAQCLVGCPPVSRIYEDVPLIFSALTALGQPYPHEILEELPKKIEDLLIKVK